MMCREHGVDTFEWWTEGEPEAALYSMAIMPDEVFFRAAVSPMMLTELLVDAPLDDFFEHMQRELALRIDEWKRGLHAPQVPDLTQHIIGFREWKIDWRNKTLGPIGIGGAPWSGRNWQDAECRGAGTRAPYGHSSPHPDCDCGLYALHDFPDEPTYGSAEHPGKVWGVVQAKGRIEVHKTGFRAEYARPMMLAQAGTTEWFVPRHDASGRLVTNAEYHRLSPEEKQAAQPVESRSDRAIAALAKSLGLDFVRWDYVRTKAQEYGLFVPQNLRPE